MLDLDDFKAYNDRHGHEAGNQLLKGIAGAIDGACRQSDLRLPLWRRRVQPHPAGHA